MNLIAPLLGGIAVLVVTIAADRLGGRLGGMLATAPMATTAALLSLASDGGMAAKVAAGGMSLFAAILGMPAFFFAVKWTRALPVAAKLLLPARLAAGLTAYLVVFTGTTLLAQIATPTWMHLLWFPATLLLVAGLNATFTQAPISALKSRGPRPPLRAPEIVARFMAGALAVALVEGVSALNPVLGAAWAVFPGTFLVGITVMGLNHGAAFAAKASQSGVLGAVPLTAFLLGYFALVSIHTALWWTWVSIIPAWGLYFVVLAMLTRQPKADPPAVTGHPA